MHELGRRKAVHAMLCVINAERQERGLARVSLNRRLSKAARRHSKDMVRRRYFSHETKGGRRWAERVRSTGYTAGADYYRIGETLAWGGRHESTARSRVNAWLKSRPHRRVLLRPEYRDVGIGIVFGTPVGRRGATFTADFGRRRSWR